mmetsp:Transcript_43301/g.57298  ORF Transcript_43301/g.57298 Transcript_43301/m.57298 type:complete len:89 (+) Transcript_43301:118-384(+)
MLSKGAHNVSQKFPGANSISFNDQHMKELNCRKTVVCEKTDGVRVFLCEFVHLMPNKQVRVAWYVIDRMYSIHQVMHVYDLPPQPRFP